LVILQRLLEGPASGNELVRSVGERLGSDAYPQSKNARDAGFKRDRANLRAHLLAEVRYDPGQNVYILDSPGPFAELKLSQSALDALGLLARDFQDSLGEYSQVTILVDELMHRLGPEQRRSLERSPATMHLELNQQVDKSTISPRVWQTLQKALGEHRKLAFSYLSPRYADRKPARFELAPVEIRFEAGHWYLWAYVQRRRKPGEWEDDDLGYRRFRLSSILDDEELRVLPAKVSSPQRRKPSYPVVYQLLPPLSQGEISYHFDDVHIEQLPDGSAMVRGTTDDLYRAERILLGYGELCIVYGGQELHRRMQDVVEEMATHYGLITEDVSFSQGVDRYDALSSEID
jgi:predicted DNA-binding transcriptional regulator YafY